MFRGSSDLEVEVGRLSRLMGPLSPLPATNRPYRALPSPAKPLPSPPEPFRDHRGHGGRGRGHGRPPGGLPEVAWGLGSLGGPAGSLPASIPISLGLRIFPTFPLQGPEISWANGLAFAVRSRRTLQRGIQNFALVPATDFDKIPVRKMENFWEQA